MYSNNKHVGVGRIKVSFSNFDKGFEKILFKFAFINPLTAIPLS